MSKPTTETRDATTIGIDTWETGEIISSVLDHDAAAIASARTGVEALASAVEAALDRLDKGGRVHYFGAGASGRLALLDATEATPTFGAPPGLFTAHFAGGPAAVVDSTYDLEDAQQLGFADASDLTGDDVVVGVTASGSTPYVAGAFARAHEVGALTVLIACAAEPALAVSADIVVLAPTGPEAIAGSTRLGAGTATKSLLNAFSTALMVRWGRTYSNLMVNLVVTNDKLRERAIGLLIEAAGVGRAQATELLAESDGDLPLALSRALTGADVADCRRALETAGSVRAAVTRIVSSQGDRPGGN